MNTVKSFWTGWGALCVAGAGAYVFAKRSINADRQARLEEQRRRKQLAQSLEKGSGSGSTSTQAPTDKPTSLDKRPLSEIPGTAAWIEATCSNEPPRTDWTFHPSQEASFDPAPTRPPPANEAQRILEKGKFERSKYEASEAYRSRKGDRFS
ncbi:hypothetical protein VTJ04DRAFT_8064 [Mycothermus thermophilus]|uniref:uncharacterized protein n=1 Tax=Humicola insolens TaxID=85995 RepID=UPI0037434B51